jgi:hypothetical protein
LVLNDIDAIVGVNVKLDEDDNALLEGLCSLDEEPNLNTHGIDDIPAALDLDTKDKGKRKVGPLVQGKKRNKGVQFVSQHLISRICEAIESKSTMTSMSYDKPGCGIKEVMDVVRRIAESENDIDILKFVTEVFLKRSHRDMFVTIKEPWLHIDFIK